MHLEMNPPHPLLKSDTALPGGGRLAGAWVGGGKHARSMVELIRDVLALLTEGGPDDDHHIRRGRCARNWGGVLDQIPPP